MSDDALKIVASTALQSIFGSGKVSTPISAMSLLTRVIGFKLPAGLFPDSPPPRFRLTDLARFESILESLSTNWDRANMTLVRENGELTVVEVVLASSSGQGGSSATGTTLGESFLNSRKRKRVVDEEADSAAGDDESDDPAYEEQGLLRASSTLANLNKEQREIYAMMQRSTAKGRLLAEQVNIPGHTTKLHPC